MSSHTYETESILNEALKLNSDIGRHVKNCSFSTHLTGRFYQNNSLESHKARAQRVAQMKAKRKQLERSLELEEKKILYLEAKLEERRLKRLEEEELRQRALTAAIVIQSHTRRFLSNKRLEILRVENEIVNYIVKFIQSLFRGRRDRKRVYKIRMMIIKHRKEELAAILIQSYARRWLAKIELAHKIEELIMRYNEAAKLLQAHIRGLHDRKFVKALVQTKSAVLIQSHYRGMLGRRMRDFLIKALKKKKEKAKRIPLHERRYSTYSIDSSRRDSIGSRRRFSEIASAATNLTTERRLSGLELLRLEHARNEQKEKEKEYAEVENNSKHSSNKDADNSKQSFEGKFVDVPKSTNEQDKILRYRQIAAARVAKLKRKAVEEKERQQRIANERKKELDTLEQNRRNMIKQQMSTRKAKLQRNNSEETKDSIVTKLRDAGDIFSEQRHQILGNKDNTMNLGFDAKFDDKFEEEFRENEFDLDDIG